MLKELSLSIKMGVCVTVWYVLPLVTNSFSHKNVIGEADTERFYGIVYMGVQFNLYEISKIEWDFNWVVIYVTDSWPLGPNINVFFIFEML